MIFGLSRCEPGSNSGEFLPPPFSFVNYSFAVTPASGDVLRTTRRDILARNLF